MLRKQSGKQTSLEFVSIEELVPKDHLVRKIDRAIDFNFIRERVKGLYCEDNGRPPVDPVVLFKMLFLGYLFGIRSERRLVREIEVNVAYRWFLGFGLTDKVPHDSIFSQNRRRRFSDSSIYQEIFDEIVMQAIKRKMVDGKILYTDSTHLKANANKNKFKVEDIKKSTKDYLDQLEGDVNRDRAAKGKKPLKSSDSEPELKAIKVSTTDPESGYMVRDGKPTGFFYLDHRTVDGCCGIITDTFVTPANVHDSIPYLERLDRQTGRFGFEVEAVGLDAGYSTAGICKGLEEREIYGVIGYRRPTHKKGYLRKNEFVYDTSADVYRCPTGHSLTYRTTTREGYRNYSSNPQICKECPLLSACTQSANHTKVITRHIWQESKDRIDLHRLSEEGREIYQRRKETVERSFADSKQLHGHRYARMRGLKRVFEQSLLCAAVQNMKKIALAVYKELFLHLVPTYRGLYSGCYAPKTFLILITTSFSKFQACLFCTPETANPA